MDTKIYLQKLIVLIFLGILNFGIHSQIIFSSLKHEFGVLEPYADRFVDITLTNKSDKKAYVLTVKKPGEVSYIIEGKVMDKDSSVVLRLQVNPGTKGRFNYLVSVYVSDRSEPVEIKLAGVLNELPTDDLSAFTMCPDFGSHPANTRQFDLTVVTLDKETKKELSNTKVAMIQNGTSVWQKITDKSGKIKEKSTLGFSYFYAKHEAYKTAELGAYINFKRNYIVIELEKDPSYPFPTPVELASTEEIVEVPLEIELNEVLDSETVLPPTAPIEFAALDLDDFSVEHFRPVNVVFVLDVSSSMQQGEKLELMKYSLYQLSDMLRPGDKMGIVTYATDTRVLLPPTDGAQKDVIREEIELLKASGLTAGGEGIKLGYKQALKASITNGVNQIIVITDGAFNRNSDDYLKFVKKYRKKGLTMSVVGISIKEPDRIKMEEAAKEGGGRLVQIMKLSDAQNNLKQEIRLSAFRK